MGKCVYILVGPTAVGKSEVAMIIARKLDAWIISADSRQVYVGMDIGTAKPDEVERSKVKHFCIDIVKPDRIFSTGEFIRASSEIINKALDNGKNVLIVGGTGLYVKALVEGYDLANLPRIEEIHDELITRLEEKGLDDLVRELHEIDPVAYESIDIKNPRRVIRALEIIKSSGKPLDEARGKERNEEFDFKIVGLRRNRECLKERIRLRTFSMIHSGWLDEVRELMKQGYPEDSPAMTGIGYMELRQHINGEITMDYAIERIIIRTRQYAKRQMTWFNAQDYIKWVDVNSADNSNGIAERVIEIFNEN
jgi:tRNA dimethylallyltransferase